MLFNHAHMCSASAGKLPVESSWGGGKTLLDLGQLADKGGESLDHEQSKCDAGLKT